MSQHKFKSGAFTVIAGWDRPLQHCFLVVYRGTAHRPVYSNLSEQRGGLTVAEVGDRLAALKIAPPAQLLANLASDAEANLGNVYTYDDERS